MTVASDGLIDEFVGASIILFIQITLHNIGQSRCSVSTHLILGVTQLLRHCQSGIGVGKVLGVVECIALEELELGDSRVAQVDVVGVSKGRSHDLAIVAVSLGSICPVLNLLAFLCSIQIGIAQVAHVGDVRQQSSDDVLAVFGFDLGHAVLVKLETAVLVGLLDTVEWQCLEHVLKACIESLAHHVGIKHTTILTDSLHGLHLVEELECQSASGVPSVSIIHTLGVGCCRLKFVECSSQFGRIVRTNHLFCFLNQAHLSHCARCHHGDSSE